MITKESLVKDRENSNIALLELKKKYRRDEHTIFLIVEGKDDIAYYHCIVNKYIRDTKFFILPANNRKNVIRVFLQVSWDYYSRKRVFFFIDRDLSNLLNEYTPDDLNVYVTDKYSIENSVFTIETMLSTIKVFYGVYDLDTKEEKLLSELYLKAYTSFCDLFCVVMAWIVCWRKSGINCNLNNLISDRYYYIHNGVFIANSNYQTRDVIIDIHNQCNVMFSDRSIGDICIDIERNGGIDKIIRGKYVKVFFVHFIASVVNSFNELFPNRNKPKATVSLSSKNALGVLAGYSVVPDSLHAFFECILRDE